MTARDLLRFRARSGGPAGPRVARAALLGVATLGVSALVRSEGPVLGRDVRLELAFWAGLLLAAMSAFRALDRGLLSDEPPRLVTLGVDPLAVARYHLALSVGSLGGSLGLAAAASLPWLDGLGAAGSTHALAILLLPAVVAGVVGTAAHAAAGEALLAGHAERLKRMLGGSFGSAEAAPLLYSGGGALAVTGVGAVFLHLALRDWATGKGAGPLGLAAVAAAVGLIVAAMKTLSAYGRAFHRIVPRIAEVAAPWAGVPGERPRRVRGADLIGRLQGVAGAVAVRDLLQVRRAHRLDLPLRVAVIAALCVWRQQGAPSPVLVGAGWGLVVAFFLPAAARAVAPTRAPRWLHDALALRAAGASARGGLIAALWFDLPVLVAIGVCAGPVAALLGLGAGVAAHAVGRGAGLLASRAAAVAVAALLWVGQTT